MEAQQSGEAMTMAPPPHVFAAAGSELVARLTAGLEDIDASTISLTRDEANLAIGFVEAAVNRIEHEAPSAADARR